MSSHICDTIIVKQGLETVAKVKNVIIEKGHTPVHILLYFT